MKKTVIKFELPRLKRRAVELYDADSPFRSRVERNRKKFQRRPKHQKLVDNHPD
jgi:hypothetical protein